MQYKDVRKPLPEIARELNVQGVIEGSVFRAGDRVRITLQLIDARNDLHLWAETYERDLRDVLALQSDVARAVADQIRLELTPDEQAALTPSRTVKPEAYDAYLRGLQLRGPAGLVGVWGPKAMAQFEQAVELDPNFAEGWTLLAGTRSVLGSVGFLLQGGLRGEFTNARAAAEKALEIDDGLATAHTVLGMFRLHYDWDFTGARRAFERAVQLAPSEPGVLNGYAWYLILVEGNVEEALEYSERLLRVAPLEVFWRGERVRHFVFAREYERALEEIVRIREVHPSFVQIEEMMAYSALGQFAEAHRAHMSWFMQAGAGLHPFREAFERGWAEGGWEESWRTWLELMTQTEGASPWLIASGYCVIGETDEAFTWLERAYRERDPPMISLKSSPAFDPIRSDPRFDDLLRRIGFPEE
jgi:tetratricopeptide (TPR) repeat protein